MLAKNTASQYAVIYVHDTLGDIPKTGYAASLTGYISKDGAAFAATDDVNPTELAYGFYQFTLTQAETNANEMIFTAVPASTQFQVQSFKYTSDNGLKAETALIVADTNEIQGKLPTNRFMGSSDGADDDSTLNSILTDTGTTLENRLIAIEADTDVIDDGTSGLVKIASDVAAVLVDTGTTLPAQIAAGTGSPSLD